MGSPCTSTLNRETEDRNCSSSPGIWLMTESARMDRHRSSTARRASRIMVEPVTNPQSKTMTCFDRQEYPPMNSTRSELLNLRNGSTVNLLVPHPGPSAPLVSSIHSGLSILHRSPNYNSRVRSANAFAFDIMEPFLDRLLQAHFQYLLLKQRSRLHYES